MRPEREPNQEPSYQAILRAFQSLTESFLADPSPEQAQRLWTQERRLLRAFAKPGRFDLGQLVMTPGVETALETSFHSPIEFLILHKQGSWGTLEPEDLDANERAVQHGSRLVSSYRTRQEDKLWVITEWDRSITTMLLPSEY